MTSLFKDKLHTAGEHAFSFQGEAGPLEGVLMVPQAARSDKIAILGHPHSLQGGTMQNKVVTTMARSFRDLQIPSLRFNFRGVGNSEGAYDDGIGEGKDMIRLYDLWQEAYPDTDCFFAGFSFGSYVAYRAAAQRKFQALISIAPPVPRYDYLEFIPSPSPWIILQGIADEVVAEKEVADFLTWTLPQPQYITFPETGHFFHGKLHLLKEKLMEIIGQHLNHHD